MNIASPAMNIASPVVLVTLLSCAGGLISAATATTFAAADSSETKPDAAAIKTLLVTGHNNHNWQFTSRLHADTLEATGRFAVTITDDPATYMADKSKLADVALIVLDYNDMHQAKRWGEAAEKNFLEAVSGGVGVVSIHSANNAFKGWAEYEKMIGLLWRETAGHGPFHSFDVKWTQPDHPVLAGLPPITNHPDELYHGLSNPQAAKYTLLAEAMSAKDKGGTGKNEPMILTLQYGKGRIFATPLGHVWTGDQAQKKSILDPQFRMLLARGAEWAATGQVTLGATFADVRPHNTLTAAEQADGWKLLFDGKTTSLRGFKSTTWPKEGWAIEGQGAAAVIRHLPKVGGADIVTPESYSEFEFKCDWMAAPGANSGIIYLCDEKHDYTWQTGYEMQILDNAGHVDGKKDKTSAGSLYDLVAPGADVVRPAGEWNVAEIKVTNSKVNPGKKVIEQRLNGYLIVQIDTGSDEYKTAHGSSKWPGMKDFGTLTQGHIALQDHGDDVRFRNIKVKGK